MKHFLFFYLIIAYSLCELCWAEPQIRIKSPRITEAQNLLQDLARRSRQADLSNLELIDYLRKLIEVGYEYKVMCDQSLFLGISEWNCIIGLKSLLAALEQEEIMTNPDILGVTEILIRGPSTWAATEPSWRELNLSIPYNAHRGDVARYVHYHLLKPRRQQRRMNLEKVANKLEEIQNQYRIAFEINKDILPEQMLRSVEVIEDLIQNKHNLILRRRIASQPDLLTIVLANAFEPVSHENQELRTSINTKAPQARISPFLDFQFEMFDPTAGFRLFGAPRTRWSVIQRYVNSLEEIQVLMTQLKVYFPNLILKCGEENEHFWINRCLDGLKSFSFALQEIPDPEELGIQVLQIMNFQWTPNFTQLSEQQINGENKIVFKFSSDMSSPQLTRYLIQQNPRRIRYAEVPQ